MNTIDSGTPAALAGGLGSRPLRIALDGTCVCHGSRAIRRYVVNLMRCLTAQAGPHRYTLMRVHPRGPGRFHEGLQVCDIPIPGRLLYPLWRSLGIPPADVFTGRVDVFHATDMELPRPSRRTPLVWTVHGLSYVARPDLLPAAYVSNILRWLEFAVRNCAHFIAVSGHTAELLQSHYPQTRGRVSVVPLGVGTEFTPAGERSPLVSPPYVLFVGALSALKNVDTLVRAFTRFRQQTGSAHKLVLAGPPDEQWWPKVDKGPYASDIITPGHIDQDRPTLAELYRGADLFVFPSYTEGWTSPPLEAMASGVPVVCSNVSSLPETVGDAALQISPDDDEGFATAMCRLFQDPVLRQECVERGRLHAAHFTWERMAAATVAVYEKVALLK